MEDFHQKYSKLLQEFGALPKPKASKSIFDITSRSYYENVISDILAFYFDPDNEHGLRDLMLRSLVNLTDSGDIRLDNVKVTREFPTIGKGRIDFLVETDDQIIGIENKKFSKLHNNLEDYSVSIDQLAENLNKEANIKIVLSINDLKCDYGFVNITYRQYCAKIRENLGKYVNASSQKWTLFLIDFLIDFEKLGGIDIDMNNPLDNFFISKDEEINFLIKARDDFVARLPLKVNALAGLCDEIKGLEECSKQWIFKNICLVHQYELSAGAAIKLDLFIFSSGWELSILSANHESIEHLTCLLDTDPLFEKGIKDKGTYESYGSARYLLAKYDLTANLEDIAKGILEWSNILIETDKNYNAKNKETNPDS